MNDKTNNTKSLNESYDKEIQRLNAQREATQAEFLKKYNSNSRKKQFRNSRRDH